MELAAKFGRPFSPLLTRPARIRALTPKTRQAKPSRGICARWRGFPFPIIVTVTGEGGSGGALAIAVGDRVISSKTASIRNLTGRLRIIIWRDSTKAETAASP